MPAHVLFSDYLLYGTQTRLVCFLFAAYGEQKYKGYDCFCGNVCMRNSQPSNNQSEQLDLPHDDLAIL